MASIAATTGVAEEICLNMIVRNEARTIERCLEVASWCFTCFFIHDTGSDDDTAARIRAWSEYRGVPGRVEACAFKDFGHNRTAALRGAVAYLTEERRADPLRSYILLLDADMLLKRRAPSVEARHLPIPGASVYHILQKTSSLVYPNIRMLRLDAAATACYKERTHEYLSVEGVLHTIPVEDVWIRDLGDGGCKADKFERDRALLEATVREDPANRRALFYLANTYKDLGRWEDAIGMYNRRIAAQGWAEEIYVSYLYRGDVARRLDQTGLMLASWLQSVQINPRRVEGLYRVIAYLREVGRQRLAWAFLDSALAILEASRGTTDWHRFLFVEHPVRAYRLREEESILAYYNRAYDRGRRACELLLADESVPDAVRSLARKNQVFYGHAAP